MLITLFGALLQLIRVGIRWSPSYINSILEFYGNDGKATFHRINCETHIDITAITTTLNYKIKSWEVIDEEMFSDHLCLHTVLSHTAKYKRQILNHKKTNWEQFRAILEQQEWPPLTINKVEDIGEAVTVLNNRISYAANIATPKI